MAVLDSLFPPGDYPLVVVGSGPGALQVSYCLRSLGVEHAVISADPAPGGMFRKWPLFQRMLSWTKPFSPAEHESRTYERYDWNSLIAENPAQRAVMTRVMDGTSYFPSRPEMEEGLRRFAEDGGVRVRYGCRWESTRHEDGRFVLGTSEGEFRTPIAVFAVGVAEPWTPSSTGMEHARHYADVGPAEAYADKRVFIVGKQNSAFEIASSLLPWARQIVLASPRPAQLSVVTRSLVGVRARYVQPFEDHALGGGVFVLDASIHEISRRGEGFTVRTAMSADATQRSFEVDEVIAATGFTAPLQDLPQLGVQTFGQSGLPAQTAFWESSDVPNIYFAGTITQGAQGLKKHGLPSNSGAVHGHRYNARVLAFHLARKHFGVRPEPVRVQATDVVSHLVGSATRTPELWHQRAYLAHVLSFGPAGITDEGILPLEHFLDPRVEELARAAAMTIEANRQGEIYPVLYVRDGGAASEHALTPDPLYEFASAENRHAVEDALKPLLGSAVTV